MNALVVPLTLQKKDFASNAESARLDMEKFGSGVKQVNAELTVMQREARAAGGGTEAQTTKIKELSKALLALKQDLQTATAEYKTLSAIAVTVPEPPKPAAPRAVPSAPDAGAATAAESRRMERAAQLSAEWRESQAGGAKRPATATGPGGNAEPEGGHGAGGGRMAGMEVGHSVRSVADMLGAGQNLTQALQMELPRIMQAAGVGVGGMIATELATSIARALESAIQGRAVERQKFGQELAGSGGGGTATTSASGLKAHIDELQKAAAARLDATGNGAAGNDGNIFSFLARKGQNFMRAANPFGERQKSVEAETDDKIEQLEQRRIELSNELVKRKADAVALDQRALAEGEDAVAADRERLALKEKIAAVLEDTSVDATAQAHMIDLLHEESKLRQEHLKLIGEQKAAELKTAESTATNKAKGYDNDVTNAQDVLKEAQAKLDAVSKTSKEGSKERRAAEVEALNAKTALRAAEQEQAVREQKRLDDTHAAQRGGSEAQKRRQGLNDDLNLVNSQLDPTSDKYERNGEKRYDLGVRRTQLQAQLRGENKADDERKLDERASAIEGDTGRGPEEKLKTLRQEIDLLRDRGQLITDQAAKENRGLGEDESAKLKDYTAQMHKLREEMDDVRESETARLDTIEQQTAALQQQGHQLSGAEKADKLTAKYQKQIDKDNFDGDPAAAAAHGKERDAAVFDAQVEEEMMTPAQRRKRAKENFKRQQAEERVRTRQKRHAENEAADDTRGAFAGFFDGDRHMPDRSFGVGTGAQPDRRASAPAAGEKGASERYFHAQEAHHKDTIAALGRIEKACDFKERG